MIIINFRYELKEEQLYESYKEALKLLHASKTHDAEVLLNEALNSRLLFNEVWFLRIKKFN